MYQPTLATVRSNTCSQTHVETKYSLLHTQFNPYFWVVCIICMRVDTGLGHLGQPGHVLLGSSRSDPVDKVLGSDLDSALNYMQ